MIQPRATLCVLITSVFCSLLSLEAFAQEKLPLDTVLPEYQTIKLNLNQAIEIALQDNPTVQIADLTVQKQRYANAQVAAALYPQVNINGSYGYTIKKPVMYLSLPGMGTRAIEMGRTHNIQAAATAVLPVVAPQLWQSIALNKTQMELSLEKARSSRIEMIAEVKKAYMAALLAEDSYRVFKSSYANALNNLKDIEAKYKVGAIAEFDKIRAEVQVKNIEPNLLQAESGRELAYDRLKLLLSVDMQQPITLTEQLDSYKDHILDSYIYVASQDIENNSTLRQLTIQDTLLQKSVKLKKLAFVPTLSLSGTYDYSYSNDEFKLAEKMFWTPHSVVSVSLSIPVFSGGKRYYAVKERQTDITMLRLQQDDAKRKIGLAVKQQQTVLATAVKRYAAANKAVAGAERGYQIAEKRYSTGAGTLLEVNDSDMQLLQARLNLDQAIYDFMVALADLEKLTGKTSTDAIK